MSETTEGQKKKLSLGNRGKLGLKGGDGSTQVKQSFSHGRTKAVQVETVRRKKRGGEAPAPSPQQAQPAAPEPEPKSTAKATLNLKKGGDKSEAKAKPEASADTAQPTMRSRSGRQLTEAEREARLRALRGASTGPETAEGLPPSPARARAEAARKAAEEQRRAEAAAAEAETEAAEEKPGEEVLDAEELRRREKEELQKIRESDKAARERAESERQEAEAKKKAEAEAQAKAEQERKAVAERAGRTAAAKMDRLQEGPAEEEADRAQKKRGKVAKQPPAKARPAGERRRSGKLTVTQALNDDVESERMRSLASVKRAREKERRQEAQEEAGKVAREVTIPDTITVQELSNRMAERGGDVIKALMKMGMMVTITQAIDADTAELIVEEFGHKVKRVSESDVEVGLEGGADSDAELLPRPPVVTIMGHVDHGKTSLLDALRQTDVVAGEAGGITQHIGAYQITMASGDKITFVDTPGHAAFTEMRARGATITDIVVIVVAADDGIMPQTIEAISHARAAHVPIIIAVNKIDRPQADPARVKQELLQHEIVVEDLGGDVQCIEVSAKEKLNLEKLEEAILLQSEILELKANPDRSAMGTVVEAKVEKGRGSVATVLVQKGTLRVGDIFITGTEWGRVRALVNDKGEQVKQAEPGLPIEVLGLNGTPGAGDDFVVVDNEARAREISEYRDRKKREATAVATKRGSLDQLFESAREGEKAELGLVIKADVHGSSEAIVGALEKIVEDIDEVDIKILHSGVGAISESDITLASASDAMIVGFNVRANAQAREMARREGTEIRYYSVIYNIIDDVKAAVSGMLSPNVREEFIGYAEIRQVFSITKVGKVAGCYITDGVVRRGAGVRLLRDDVVIHEGTLKTLKRFKDEVKEVQQGYECGMAFENYDDIKEGDVIEAFEIIEERRQL